MKISAYPKIQLANANDLLVISGIAGDRKITTSNLLIHRPITDDTPQRNVTLTAEGWDISTIRQSVNVPGIKANSVFLWDVAFHTSRDEYLRFVRGGIRPVMQTDDFVTFQAFFFKPEIPIHLILWLLS